jgi:plastocyanin
LTWRALAPIAVLVLVAAACGGSSNDTASSGSASSGANGTTRSTASTGSTGSSGSSGGGGGYSRYGGGNGGGGGGNNGGSDDSTHGSGATVTANNYSFAPTKLTVQSGTELQLSNANANTPHTFTIDGTDVDVSLEPMSNEDVKIDLDPGRYPFHCKIHPSMTGTLTVT